MLVDACPGSGLETSKQKILSLLSSAESQPWPICREAPSDLRGNADRLPSVHSPQVQVHPPVALWVQHSPHPEAVSPSHGNATTRLPGLGLQGEARDKDREQQLELKRNGL